MVALEGREDNVRRARLVLETFGAASVDFRHYDVERFETAEFGHFDWVFCAGLLYHLPEPWTLLRKLSGACRFLFLDTHYAATAEAVVGPYHGRWHGEGSDPLSGLSGRSFWLTFKDLVLVLLENGFLVRHVHDGGNGEGDRIWLLAEQVGPEVALVAALRSEPIAGAEPSCSRRLCSSGPAATARCSRLRAGVSVPGITSHEGGGFLRSSMSRNTMGAIAPRRLAHSAVREIPSSCVTRRRTRSSARPA